MPKLHVYKNEKETCYAFAEWLVEFINDSLKQHNIFTLALSAGEIPKSFFRTLAMNFTDAVDWSKVHLFWGDKRLLAFSEEKHNTDAGKLFIDNLPIPNDQIHIINTEISPEQSAHQYESILKEFFPDSNTTFNLVILGLGEDGNTLSLFPGNEENNLKSSWVIPVYNQKEDLYRITLTSSIINAAEVKAFLITGKSKQDAVEKVLKGKYEPEKYPAQLIQTVNKTVHWFMDEAAAGKLIKPAS